MMNMHEHVQAMAVKLGRCDTLRCASCPRMISIGRCSISGSNKRAVTNPTRLKTVLCEYEKLMKEGPPPVKPTKPSKSKKVVPQEYVTVHHDGVEYSNGFVGNDGTDELRTNIDKSRGYIKNWQAQLKRYKKYADRHGWGTE